MVADFLINTPSHKRWYLPDNRHQYNSVMYGDTIRVSVIDSLTGESKHVGYINILKPGWEDLCALTQELAAKRYPKELFQIARQARLRRSQGRQA